ncbi:hypothetical protein [Brucella intermedia]|uniref:hypothetical protein n=1 Tax=Brucella intermedia TaxID=94625 RepID=UPI003C7A4C9E
MLRARGRPRRRQSGHDEGLTVGAAADGEAVTGKFTGTVQPMSGKFALVKQCQ